MTAAARALVLRRLGGAPRLETLEVPEPGAGEVRVRMLAAGLCHTDVAAVTDAFAAPIVLGHEGCGEVESVGAGVTAVCPGDRVVLSWRVPCGGCRACAGGRPHLCERGLELRPGRSRWRGEPIPGLLSTGCFAELLVLPAEAAVRVEADLPPEQAALVGCGIATGVGAVLYAARVEPDASVAVWGAGGVGLNVVAGARLARARTIVAVDPEPEQLRLAAARGTTHAAAPEAAAATIAEATGGRGADYAFEAVGREDAFVAALDALAVGGELVVLGGMPPQAPARIVPRSLLRGQQRITGCIYGWIRPQRDLPLLARWCAQGLVPVADLVARTIGLDELPDAFDARQTGGRTVVRFA